MTIASVSTRATQVMNLRVREDDKALFDRAASLVHKNRSQFVLDAARAAAVDAVTDQALIAVPADVLAHFYQVLDAPPEPNADLRATMGAVPPWNA